MIYLLQSVATRSRWIIAFQYLRYLQYYLISKGDTNDMPSKTFTDKWVANISLKSGERQQVYFDTKERLVSGRRHESQDLATVDLHERQGQDEQARSIP